MQGPNLPLHGDLYFSIIMDRYAGSQTYLTLALHGGLYLAIIMESYGGPQSALTIILHRDL
jgi:hypothetical protein